MFKKLLSLSSLALLMSFSMSAQNIAFAPDTLHPYIQGALFGDLKFADIDNDGDQDLFVCGRVDGWSSNDSTHMYLNDGTGQFSEMEGTDFPNVQSAEAEFEDIDNDGDLDLLIVGLGDFPNNHADLFINDGNGNYTQNTAVPFTPLSSAHLDFGDVDGDGDQDVFITGLDTDEVYHSDLYLNDGSGQFSASAQVFDGDTGGPAILFDIDTDGDLDILRSTMATIDGDDVFDFSLHLNDGSASFSLASDPFEGRSSGALSADDVDGDGDMDLLITGNVGTVASTTLYLNDGAGGMELYDDNDVFINLSIGENMFADCDNDGDLDIITVGTEDGGLSGPLAIPTIIYENTGGGEFEFTQFFFGAYFAEIDIADIDGDGFIDMVIGGTTTGLPSFKTWLVRNISAPNSLSEQASIELSIYPNPTSDVLIIESDEQLESLSVYSLSGQEVINTRLQGQVSQIDFSGEVAGTYIAVVKTSVGEKAVVVTKE